MPVIGHALVGAAAAAATLPDVRSRPLAACWPGLLVSLAYAPDLLEWPARLGDWPVPSDAFCSLPTTAVVAGLIVLLLRYGFGERRLIVHLAAVGAFASHGLMDMAENGVPLWWPWSSADVLLPWQSGDLPATWAGPQAELHFYGPWLAAGLAVLIWRRSPSSGARATAGAGVAAVLVAALLAQAVIVAAGVLLLGGLAIWVYRPGPRVWLGSLAGMVPLLVVGAVQLYAWQQYLIGEVARQNRDYATAALHFRAAWAVRPVDSADSALTRLALCYEQTGQLDVAEHYYRTALRLYPGCDMGLYGLGKLLLNTRDPAFYRPEPARELLSQAASGARHPELRAAAQRWLDRLEAGEIPPPAGAVPAGHPAGDI
jgi:hypothetical protein